MINCIRLINDKIIDLEDLKLLKSGLGLPFLISLNCDGIFVKARAIMKVYGTVIIHYDDENLNNMIYKGKSHGYNNGLEKFIADVKLFQSKNSFQWILNKNITNIEFLELMPDFHCDLLKTNRRALREFIKFSEETLKLINDNDLKVIKEVYNIFNI